MILGSHNTMTYLKPRKWWMWLGRFMAKCQSRPIKQQYDKGARWFDLRISYIEKDTLLHPVFSHGMMNFKGDIEPVLMFLNSKDNVYCRFVLEKGNKNVKQLFICHVALWMARFPNLKVTQIVKKGEWENLIEPNATMPLPGKDAYASSNGYYPKYQNLPGFLKNKTISGLLIDDLWPWIYAKFNNKKNLKKYKDDDIVLLIDFI